MNFPFEVTVALRYLKSRRKETFISIISLISLAGITLGVAALIIVLAVMNGFDQDLKEKILGIRAHIRVTGRLDQPLPDYRAISEQIVKVPGVKACGPFVFSQIIVKAKYNSIGVVAWGIDPAVEGGVSDLDRNLLGGRLPDRLKSEKPPVPSGIILGSELARHLDVSEGDPVILIAPIFTKTPAGLVPKMANFKVTGIFRSGMYEYDSTFAYINLSKAQDFFNLGDRVSGINVRVNDTDEARKISSVLRRSLSASVSVRDWIELNRNLFSALRLEKTVMSVILTLIVLVAVFNILSMLIMVTMEKKKDIGILKAMGATSRSIGRIFMLEGVTLGIAGSIIGTVIGITVSLALQKYHFVKLAGDVYYLDALPARLLAGDIAGIVAAAIFLSFISTIYPAWHAAKLDPVEAIRYE